MTKMALNFPNPSRSYDQSRHCVRFWAYDEALEISFFVEEDALRGIDLTVPPGAEGLLNAFDLQRERIFDAAERVYSRRSRGSYTLKAKDLR
jgi:Protein of unknown function (DUF1488)